MWSFCNGADCTIGETFFLIESYIEANSWGEKKEARKAQSSQKHSFFSSPPHLFCISFQMLKGFKVATSGPVRLTNETKIVQLIQQITIKLELHLLTFGTVCAP